MAKKYIGDVRMKEKEKIVTCELCEGTGQDRDWLKDNLIEIKDCIQCDGMGQVKIIVRDLRKNSKRKHLIVPDKG